MKVIPETCRASIEQLMTTIIIQVFAISDKITVNFQMILHSHPVCIIGVRVIVFNATFNNISVISWRSVLLVGETGVHGENH
jgi:hypothetical protein